MKALDVSAGELRKPAQGREGGVPHARLERGLRPRADPPLGARVPGLLALRARRDRHDARSRRRAARLGARVPRRALRAEQRRALDRRRLRARRGHGARAPVLRHREEAGESPRPTRPSPLPEQTASAPRRSRTRTPKRPAFFYGYAAPADPRARSLRRSSSPCRCSPTARARGSTRSSCATAAVAQEVSGLDRGSSRPGSRRVAGEARRRREARGRGESSSTPRSTRSRTPGPPTRR